MFEPNNPNDDDSVMEPVPAEPEIQFLGPISVVGSPGICRTCNSVLNAASVCPVCSNSEMQFGDLQVSDQFRANAFNRPAYHRPAIVPRSHGSVPIGSAIALYLTLLGSFGLMFIDPGNVLFEFAVSFVDSLIVLAWVIYHRDLILPIMKLPKNPVWLLVGLMAGVVTFVLTTLFLQMLTSLMGVQVFKMTDRYFDAGFGLVTVMLVIVVQPMIVEEFAFRGVIFKIFERAVSLKEAMLISACMFAALHLSPFSAPHTFLIGMLAVVLLHHTGSIWPGVLLHGMHNFLVAAEEMWW